MTQQFVLTDFNNQKEVDRVKDLVKACTRTSEYTQIAGAPVPQYCDVDIATNVPTNAKKMVEHLADMVSKLIKDGYQFNKLGFIADANGGPVGMINIHSDLTRILEMESVIVRPHKVLRSDVIKGKINRGDRILIINDVATTGETIFYAAEKIWQLNGTVPYALVFLDQQYGATENLQRKGIQLFSVVTPQVINDELKGVVKEYKISQPVFKDLGGEFITVFN